MELADTSAWTNRHKDIAVEADFNSRVLASEIAICPMVELELLWTARTKLEFEEIREELEALPAVVISPEAWARAIDVWHELTRRDKHRQVKQPGLLIAAAAELAGVGVCHYDADFDVISAVTRQPVRAIAPIGAL